MTYEEEILKFRADRKIQYDANLLESAIAKSPPGNFMEFGVATGRTIRRIAALAPDRQIYGFDSFKGLPELWLVHRRTGAFAVEAPPEVPENVTLVVGLFQETLDSFLEQHKEPIAFIHMDADLYSSTLFVLSVLCELDRLKNTVMQFDQFFVHPDVYEPLCSEAEAFRDTIERWGIAHKWIGYCGRRHAVQIGSS